MALRACLSDYRAWCQNNHFLCAFNHSGHVTQVAFLIGCSPFFFNSRLVHVTSHGYPSDQLHAIKICIKITFSFKKKKNRRNANLRSEIWTKKNAGKHDRWLVYWILCSERRPIRFNLCALRREEVSLVNRKSGAKRATHSSRQRTTQRPTSARVRGRINFQFFKN